MVVSFKCSLCDVLYIHINHRLLEIKKKRYLRLIKMDLWADQIYNTSIVHRIKNPLQRTSDHIVIVYYQTLLYIIRMIQE